MEVASANASGSAHSNDRPPREPWPAPPPGLPHSRSIENQALRRRSFDGDFADLSADSRNLPGVMQVRDDRDHGRDQGRNIGRNQGYGRSNRRGGDNGSSSSWNSSRQGWQSWNSWYWR